MEQRSKKYPIWQDRAVEIGGYKMYIIDGIAYAGERQKDIQVLTLRPLKDYRLWVRFNTGETKIFDFTPLLSTEVFSSLEDKELFQQVYLDYGIPTWSDGAIDIAPEKLYADGVSVDNVEYA